MTYEEKLESTKANYPFDKWRELYFPDPEDNGSEGMEQYTQENCDAAKIIFDNLISGLKAITENGEAKEKEGLFKLAIESLNELNNKEEGLIETGEREDLCELIDQITITAGLNPQDYADGEGIANQWRNW